MPPVKKPKHERNSTFIRHWREFRGLTQDELADRVQVDRSTISRVERGETPYDQDLLERIAAELECNPEDLISADPLVRNTLQLICSKLQSTSLAMQARVLAVVEALLKTGDT